ncbi:T9SS type A sorting domain-containing protein [Algibacter mikhailovii]|uniref:T9SS type A sorting domain-containing protein n=1 Tax=Algibacter mikhailovii TaxID=425498 RepID=UPI00167383AD|nr:T9SS type A sorting domain-containing protein [Algibacter mikhailovii]
MKPIILFLFLFGILAVSQAQIVAVSEEFPLPTSVSESSGVIYFNNKLITHNDSGGKNELYEVDLASGLITRTITVANATNVDWEDLAQDDTSIYIGDIGNNISGNRTDLKIYKINKTDFLTADTVMAKTIAFSYLDQIDFEPSPPNTTAWDAEALVSFDSNALILFNKNWVNGITKGYIVSKTPGTYALSPLPTALNSTGLITGATYNPISAKLFLVGYSNGALPNVLQPFVWTCENFTTQDVFSGTNTLTSLADTFSFEQTEAIAYKDESNYFITSEAFTISVLSDYAKLISFSTNDKALSIASEQDIKQFEVFPNPIDNFLHIKGSEISSVQIYDTKKVLLFQGSTFLIDMSQLSAGIYFVSIQFNDHSTAVKKIIKK